MQRLLTPLCASALALAAHAQTGASGSEGFLVPARDLVSSGGLSSSSGYVAETSVSTVDGANTSASAQYRFRGGVVRVGNDFIPNAPVVFGPLERLGPAAGGELVTVQGAGFGAPGAGETSVAFGGTAATNVAVQSDTQVVATVPQGVDLFGNPLAQVDVTVTDNNGSATADDAYVYTPAIVLAEPARPGGTFWMKQLAGTGDFQDLNFGFSIPGVGIPLLGLDGQWRLLQLFISPTSFSPSGSPTRDWTLPIPPNPNLVGATVEWQSINVSDLLLFKGSWTNVLPVTFVD